MHASSHSKSQKFNNRLVCSSFQAFNSSADVGIIAEYQYDGRETGRIEDLFFSATETLAPATIADNDLFAGIRIALNDTQSTSFLIGSAIDLSTSANLTIAEAERRIGENWTIELQARVFDGRDNDPIGVFERDDFISIGFSRHF
jgi:hypothetical protein